MNGYDCDAIRDLLPSYVREEMLPHEAAIVGRHLTDCADCRTDEAIVRTIQDTLAPLPAGLEARVVAAVRRPHVTPWYRQPARLAMAATLAAAVVGGTWVFERSGLLRDRVDAVASEPDAFALGWTAAEDPLLHGSSALQELSVEELEHLLAELDR